MDFEQSGGVRRGQLPLKLVELWRAVSGKRTSNFSALLSFRAASLSVAKATRAICDLQNECN